MKNTRSGLLMAVLVVFTSLLVVAGCQKGSISDAGTEAFALYLTDDPAQFSAVNIDLQMVEVKVDTMKGRKDNDGACQNDGNGDDHHRSRDEFGKWDTLTFHPGIYNVAALRNGIDTLLATGNVTGRIRKIRITLGTQNSVTVNGTVHPLLLPPGSANYFYINLQDKHRRRDSTGEQQVWVDFDLSRSIIERNGQYYLVPKLKPFCDQNFGTLIGKVFPAEAATRVMAYNGTDTASAVAERDGRFKIRGLQPGTYTVYYDGLSPYKDTTISSVTVTAGRPVTLPEVTLKK
jgi:Domain of unknown function (DUF4382)/Carboxypeptidase regulatory-like domain